MMKVSTLPLLLALTACQSTRPALLTCAEAVNRTLLIQRCLGGDLARGKYIGDVACFPFGSPERLTGTWHVELEGSFFTPFAQQKDMRRVWLDVQNPPPLAKASMQGDVPRDFAIDLIGRRSLCPVGYGHMGITPHEIVAEKLLSVHLRSSS